MEIAKGSEHQDEAELASAVAPALPTIPYAFARDHGVLISKAAGGHLTVAMREGAEQLQLLEVRRYLGQAFDVETFDASGFEKLLSDHYAVDGSAAAMASDFDTEGLDDLVDGIPSVEDLLDSADDAPAIRLINGIIAEGARAGASDIHIEPYETGLIVRMRVDGVLTEKLRMPPHVASVIVNRIKVMARLDIAERRIPQDGRISLTLGGKLLDVRVSTLPNRANERVVMRILDKESAGISMEMLGLSDEAQEILSGALAEPNGIILVTGPTGSGKTTTLYAGMKQLNDGSRNILTVEDPVEYAIEGIGQTQANAKVGLTFAAGLRAILRQDPDVVMVGEIRDKETADIAVQAALTGHLVLSTVHTNNAVGAITRMRDMKVEPFLLASTVRAVLAQRLVRKLCEHCRKPVKADDTLGRVLGVATETAVFAAKGCEHCNHSGFRGRIGVFEAIRIDDTIRKLINEGGDEEAISAYAFKNRPDLMASATAMVLQGLTTPEEAIRIAGRQQESEHA